ncbi:hypothetical protein HDU82_000894 [Entophlyctis luteolus]|nr:hypothetical protein HDU82_000894 [Entophlyctis luteolus]
MFETAQRVAIVYYRAVNSHHCLQPHTPPELNSSAIRSAASMLLTPPNSPLSSTPSTPTTYTNVQAPLQPECSCFPSHIRIPAQIATALNEICRRCRCREPEDSFPHIAALFVLQPNTSFPPQILGSAGSTGALIAVFHDSRVSEMFIQGVDNAVDSATHDIFALAVTSSYAAALLRLYILQPLLSGFAYCLFNSTGFPEILSDGTCLARAAHASDVDEIELFDICATVSVDAEDLREWGISQVDLKNGLASFGQVRGSWYNAESDAISIEFFSVWHSRRAKKFLDSICSAAPQKVEQLHDSHTAECSPEMPPFPSAVPDDCVVDETKLVIDLSFLYICDSDSQSGESQLTAEISLKDAYPSCLVTGDKRMAFANDTATFVCHCCNCVPQELNVFSKICEDDGKLCLQDIASGKDKRTAVMLKNVPNRYTQDMLLDFVNETHKGTFDFFYLRMDFVNNCNVGYAFINFIDPKSIITFSARITGQKWPKFNSSKLPFLAPAKLQSKAAFIAQFRNSPVMLEHPEFQPRAFHSSGPHRGEPMPFPRARGPVRARSDVLFSRAGAAGGPKKDKKDGLS